MRVACMKCEAEFVDRLRNLDDVYESAFRVLRHDLPVAYVCADHLTDRDFAVPLPTRCLNE